MLPQLAAAQQATLRECANLSAIYAPAGTTLASAVMKAPGEVSVMLNGNATPMPEHCVVNGRMNSRVSPVDGRNYAISFEMRLPKDWNGRFFYQANGGLEGTVVPAYGEMLGGSPSSNALLQGFAVVSSDAGHAFDRSLPPAIGAAIFGIDPQARADFGYNTIAQVTPMAKGLISAAYGKVPDRSYIAGCSNGGRSALVAAARYTNEYDGILAGAPGLDLPKIAVMQIWDAQTAATVAPLRANGRPDFAASFSDAELAVVSRKVLEKCDALDGIADGMVGDMAQCQSKADLAQDVPTCSAASDVQCLPAAKKAALVRMLAGPRNAAGAALYASFPLDAGISAPGWRTWKIGIAPSLPQGLQRGGGAAAFLFTAPPANPTVVRDLDSLTDWVLNFSFDTDAPKIAATTETYRESAMETVNPPNATDLRALRTRGAKLMAYNGVSDPG
ncbi:MAG TPA: tannase/feruloyl esterase family alpha/beta hydrolase, partial [Rubrivivax sp.]|nr:tannase/feruloyl esterase family alpha/beta hydrolase [Rubrivivax sp.]